MEGVVGYGFHPTNAELIGYLRKKRLDPEYTSKKIGEIHLYNHEPPELPELALVKSDAPAWYFYVAINYKHANRSKRACANRRTRGGTWKVTGRERDIKDSRTNKVIGTKRTLVFYKGRTTSKDAKTNWVMDEYQCKPDPLYKGDFVVVRIKIKPNYKSDASTPTASKATSDSGDHSVVVSQEESLPPQNSLVSCNSGDQTSNFMFSKEFQPPSNHGIYLNGESELLPDHDISINKENISFNKETQGLVNHNGYIIVNDGESQLSNDGISINRESQQNILVNRESQLLLNNNEVKDNRMDLQWGAQDEFCYEETGLRLRSNFDYSNLVTGAVVCDELPPNRSVSVNEEFRQCISINGESQLLPMYGEVEDYESTSAWSAHDQFYDKETGTFLPSNFNSLNLVTGGFVCDKLPPNRSISINRESQQNDSINGESQLKIMYGEVEESQLQTMYGEVEDYGNTSVWYAHNQFYDEETGMFIPSNFNPSNLVTGVFVCDELPSNHGVSINRESQQYVSINGESQLPPNYGEVEDYRGTSPWSAQDEFYDEETGMSLRSNFDYSNLVTGVFDCDELPPNGSNFDYSNLVTGVFDCDELPPNGVVSINRESQQNISINGESQLLPSYGEVEDYGSTSLWSTQDQLYNGETGPSLPPNFYRSNPITEASVCDSTDAEAAAHATLLDGFFSMANGEYDHFYSTFQPLSYPAANENALPV